jgi:hypothetical protein
MIPVFAHRNKLHQIAAMLRAPLDGIFRTALTQHVAALFLSTKVLTTRTGATQHE